MLMGSDFCCSEFKKYGIVINSEQYEKFDKYADFLVKYNENVNLTSITEPQQILTKHFIDSVLITKYIDFPLNSTVIDVGTGAGFPSVPIKIIRPDLKITLLDSLTKRIKFLNELCNILDIDAELIHGRAEDFGKMPEYREKFDFSCARAVANLSVLSEYCIPFVKKDGEFIAMKGPNENPDDSIKAIMLLGGKIGNVFDYFVDGDKRKVISIRKISQTPTNYPRNSSQIKKKTL